MWRGPLVGGAIQQFLRDVEWGDLDYLVIDQPPGTSDAQLTLAQAIPISGTVLVTTPQDVALLDVQKALAMLKRMSVPVIGIVENMSAFVCPHCGEATEIFGRGGGERFAQQNGIEFLGGMPLDVTVRQGGDVGVPVVAQREPGPAALALTHIAQTRGGPHERARRGATAAAGALDQLDRNNLAGGSVSALRGPRRSSATPLARGLEPAAPPVRGGSTAEAFGSRQRPSPTSGRGRIRAGATATRRLCDRVLPADLREPGEIGVGRTDLQAMLDRQGGKVCVRDEVAAEPIGPDQPAENIGVCFRGLRDPRRRCRKPGVDELPRVCRCQRVGRCSRVCRDPDERGQRLPGQSDPAIAVQPLFQPCRRTKVRVGGPIDSEQQEIGVDEHLASGQAVELFEGLRDVRHVDPDAD